MHEVSRSAATVDRLRLWSDHAVARARRCCPLLLLSALAVCGCATAPSASPHGGNVVTQSPEFDVFARAWGDAQMPCMSTPTLTARARVRGTVERRRIDELGGLAWSLSENAGLGRVRLEPVDDNPSHFALVAIYSFGDRKDEATLVLPEGRRVVRSCSRARRAGAGCPLVSPSTC